MCILDAKVKPIKIQVGTARFDGRDEPTFRYKKKYVATLPGDIKQSLFIALNKYMEVDDNDYENGYESVDGYGEDIFTFNDEGTYIECQYDNGEHEVLVAACLI